MRVRKVDNDEHNKNPIHALPVYVKQWRYQVAGVEAGVVNGGYWLSRWKTIEEMREGDRKTMEEANQQPSTAGDTKTQMDM